MLVLRALTFGFMPVVEGSGMTIGICPGEATLSPGIAAAHHLLPDHLAHLRAHHCGDPADAGSGAHHAPRLFAASAAAAVAQSRRGAPLLV